ncbi:MAG: PD-(D/E)XK nuclease family protein [Thermomicrobiales bacterium]
MAELQFIANGNGRQATPPRPKSPWGLPNYSPTSLNQHANCPEAFLHERVLKTPFAEDQGSVALAKGSAVHALLQRYVCMDLARSTQFEERLESEASRALAAQGLPSANPGHLAAVDEVMTCTANGIDVLRNEYAGASLLIGEQFLSLNWTQGPAPFRLTAKIDLRACFPDGSVESLDWKTGKPRGLDQIQNIICRLVTEANASQIFKRYLPTGAPPAIRTTVCHLSTRKLTVQQFDHAQLEAEFADIRARIAHIEKAKATPVPGSHEWMPQPGPLCGWCKYAQACSYHASMGAAMPWLDDELVQGR